MLVKASEIKIGDKIVSDRSSTPMIVEDVLLKEDGTVEVRLESSFTEYYTTDAIVLVHRPV